jgi:phosphatidylserine decarboxylase
MRTALVTEGRGLLATLGLLAACGIGLWMWWRPAALALWILAAVLVGVTVFFFRDPDRTSTESPERILAPADGRVVAVEVCEEPRHLLGQARRIAIFMHVGNVHVQRTPSRGQLVWTRHQPGRWLPAWSVRAARENEQRWYAFRGEQGDFTVVQVAGLLARRTRCWLQAGQVYPRGARLGLIALGSEVDVYLPLSVAVSVQVGDRVRAGETVIGSWKSHG